MKQKKGFTLIELIVVIAILVTLLLILIPKMSGFTDTASQTVCQANTTNAYKLMIAQLTLKGSLSQDDAVTMVEDNLGSLDKLCPKGGTITISGADDTLSISCSLHGESALETLKGQASQILKTAYDGYFASGKTGTLDSTGPNFGGSMKKQLIEALNLKDDSFDFCVERRGGGSYRVYIFDSLSSSKVGELISGQMYTFDSKLNPTGSESGVNFTGNLYEKKISGENKSLIALDTTTVKN